MFQTETRRSNDEHLYSWARKILANQNKDYTAHYIGYGQFDFDQDENFVSKLFSNFSPIKVFEHD